VTTTATELTLPQVGSRLDNGCWCLASKPARKPRAGEVDCAIVLGFHSGAGAVQPFATWVMKRGGVTVLGRYFETIFEAVADYAERS